MNPLFNHSALAAQALRQRKYAWDLEKGVPWELGVDPDKPFLPLDENNIAFPGANPEQRLALSQLMGLVINSTIAEMESVINKLRKVAWEDPLRSFPVNPEMWELGELFFEEENKHALAFARFNEIFCEKMGIDPETLGQLLPKAFGSFFLKSIIKNAQSGGHAFWWIVAAVEEVSLELFRDIHQERDALDPLFYLVHKKHMEEEQRHHNYAFLMLDLFEQRRPTPLRFIHRKIDLLIGQFFSTTWVLAELHKIFNSKEISQTHPFFKTIASALPLFQKQSPLTLVKRLFISSPYVSPMLNTKYHKLTSKMAISHGAFNFPFPNPKPADVSTLGIGEPGNKRHG